MSKLQGKVALVTGAASGIGKAVAEKLASEGAAVAIADINVDSATDVASALQSDYEVEAMPVQMDVTSPSQVEDGVAAVVAQLGSVDVLVSNAGIQIIAPFVEFKFDDWRRMLNIHLDGGFLTAQACVKHMYQRGGGSIIFMGSIHSVEASKDKAAYVAAKHALLGLTRAIALEGAEHNVKANLVAPGFVETPLVHKQIPEQAKALGISEEEVVNRVMLGHTADHHFTSLDEVAETVLFLAAFKGNGLSGQSLLVTHGWNMQ